MKIEFKNEEEMNLYTVTYGDVVVLKNGSKWLIVKDSDGVDYIGVNLETLTITFVGFSIRGLLEGQILKGPIDSNGHSCEVERIIKSEELVLGER